MPATILATWTPQMAKNQFHCPRAHNPLGEDRNKQIISIKEMNAALVRMEYNTAAW